METRFGNLLSKYREQKELTLEALAEKADVSPSYISLLIRGKKGRPRKQIIEQLAQALELTEAETSEFQAAAEASKVDSLPNKSVVDSSLNQFMQDLPSRLPDDAGIEAVHDSLSVYLLKKHFPQSNTVRIQDNWLQDLFTYNSLLREMLNRHVLNKERAGVVIQVLLLKPDSPLAKLRANVLNVAEGYLRNQINSTVELFESLSKDFGRKYIEMRLFNVLPSVQQIAFDHTIFIGFNSHVDRSGATYQLQIKKDSKLGDFFREDFEKAWDIAKPFELP